MRKIPVEDVISRIKLVHGTTVRIVESTYVSCRRPAVFIDSEFGEWKTQPHHVLRGHSHPKRGLIKYRNTIKNKYGVDNISQIPAIVDKKKKTYLAKYNCDSPMKNAAIVEKSRQTRLKKYGRWDNESTIKQRQVTILTKYGVKYPCQNPTIALKQARKSNYSQIKYHWKTNKELVCIGGYESKTVDYLNKNQINYHWQPKIFIMPNGKTYCPDLYLPDQDLWIEIKGYMRPDALEKWQWFKAKYKAELWDKPKLVEMGIL